MATFIRCNFMRCVTILVASLALWATSLSIFEAVASTPKQARDNAICSGDQCATAHGAAAPAVKRSFFGSLLDTSDYPRRWDCGKWSPEVGWLHIISDLGIFSAYFAIPIILLTFLLRRRDLPFPRIIWLFAAFILSCGLGHLLEACIFWWPAYRLDGLVKAATAVISWVTVIALVRLMPELLRLPSLARMSQALRQSNTRLKCALEGGAVGIWEWAPATDSLTLDRRTRATLEIAEDAEHLALANFLERVHTKDRARVGTLIEHSARTGWSYTTHFRVVRRNGTIRYVHLQGASVTERDSDERRLIGVCIDVTSQTRHKLRLRRSAARMHSLLNTAADGIITIDRRGVITPPCAAYEPRVSLAP